jgi:hypothetical protein
VSHQPVASLFSELRYVEIGRESRIAVNPETFFGLKGLLMKTFRIELHELLSYKQVQ